MKKTSAIIAAVAISAIALTACSSKTISTAPAKTSVSAGQVAADPSTRSASASASASPSKTTAPVAHVGDTINLKDSDQNESLAVTLVKVTPTATSSDQYSNPDAGKRYFAVQFQLVNNDTAPYSDSPSNGATALDDQGQQYRSTFTEDTSAGVNFAGSVNLLPGAKALGVVVFEVPTAANITGVQFGLGSGFGAVGQWEIP